MSNEKQINLQSCRNIFIHLIKALEENDKGCQILCDKSFIGLHNLLMNSNIEMGEQRGATHQISPDNSDDEDVEDNDSIKDL